MTLHSLFSTLLPDLSHLRIQSVRSSEQGLAITITSIQTSARCPHCQQRSTRPHRRYCRRPADLPWAGLVVRWQLQLPRWVCPTPSCPKQTFVEPLPSTIQPYARRTNRLVTAQTQLAFTAGGNPGARLASHLAMPVSRPTLLRMIRRHPLPGKVAPRVIRIDDWCKRKGQTYGSIIVDLERHQVLDLLDHRSAETWASWLQQHPHVEVVARDRATAYASGTSLGAPQAVQVADRFHVLCNLRTAIEDEIKLHPAWISALALHRRAASEPHHDQDAQDQVRPPLPPHGQRQAAHRQQQREQRLRQYEQVMHLYQQGMSRARIAQQLGVGQRTVERWVITTSFPERKPRTGDRSRREPYYPFMIERREAGCHKAVRLWQDVQGQGYQGSYRTVALFCRRLRQGARPLARCPAAPGDQRTRELNAIKPRLLRP